MKNRIFIGKIPIELPQKGGFLFIHDEVPEVAEARVFDPAKHSFNPLKGIDHIQARGLANDLYNISPQGADTLTVRNGKRALARMLLQSPSLHDLKPTGHKGDEEALEMVDDLLQSPVLDRVLNSRPNFSLNPRSVLLARLNRAELGDFDALVLGLFLIGQWKGQVVLEDGGFYLRDMHTSLIRENRLITGVRFLDQLPEKLRMEVLLVDEKVIGGATYDDALLLAKHAGLVPDPQRIDNDFNRFVARAIALPENS